MCSLVGETKCWCSRSKLKEIHIDVAESGVLQDLEVLIVEHLLLQVRLSLILFVSRPIFLVLIPVFRYVATLFLHLTASLVTGVVLEHGATSYKLTHTDWPSDAASEADVPTVPVELGWV